MPVCQAVCSMPHASQYTCPQRDEPVDAPSSGVVRADWRESGRIGTVYGEGVLAGRVGLYAAMGPNALTALSTEPLVKPVMRWPSSKTWHVPYGQLLRPALRLSLRGNVNGTH